MSDVNCPYCGYDVEINHDDGYGIEEDTTHQQTCGVCDKVFVFHTELTLSYETAKAACLNGGEHKMVRVRHLPRYWPDWVRCKYCGKDERGEYQPPD